MGEIRDRRGWQWGAPDAAMGREDRRRVYTDGIQASATSYAGLPRTLTLILRG